MAERNPLYPVFLKPQALQFLIVGGGDTGSEKLRFLLKSSPDAKVRLVAPEISEEILELSARHSQVQLVRQRFNETHLIGIQVAILATADPALNREIRRRAKAWNILTNVADTPELCDFYMGSIVTRSNLKVAISTNGKSPTFAKRFRQYLETALPENDDMDTLLRNLKEIRDALTGDFAAKVEALNEITANLLHEQVEIEAKTHQDSHARFHSPAKSPSSGKKDAYPQPDFALITPAKYHSNEKHSLPQ